jgi:hypothetical protein
MCVKSPIFRRCYFIEPTQVPNRRKLDYIRRLETDIIDEAIKEKMNLKYLQKMNKIMFFPSVFVLKV